MEHQMTPCRGVGDTNIVEDAFHHNTEHCDVNRPRIRPDKKWLDNIKKDCSDLGITL